MKGSDSVDKEFLDDVIYLANNRLKLYKQNKESLYAIYKRHGKICFNKLFDGEERNIFFSYDKLEKWLREHNHRRVIVLHNHPLLEDDEIGEINYASDNDKSVTNWLIACQYKCNYKLVDHIIVIGSLTDEYYSIREDRLLKLEDRLYQKELVYYVKC